MEKLRQFIDLHAAKSGLVRDEETPTRADETAIQFTHSRLHAEQVRIDLQVLAQRIREQHGIEARVEQQPTAAGKVGARKRMWSRIWIAQKPQPVEE